MFISSVVYYYYFGGSVVIIIIVHSLLWVNRIRNNAICFFSHVVILQVDHLLTLYFDYGHPLWTHSQKYITRLKYMIFYIDVITWLGTQKWVVKFCIFLGLHWCLRSIWRTVLLVSPLELYKGQKTCKSMLQLYNVQCIRKLNRENISNYKIILIIYKIKILVKCTIII